MVTQVPMLLLPRPIRSARRGIMRHILITLVTVLSLLALVNPMPLKLQTDVNMKQQMSRDVSGKEVRCTLRYS